MNRSDPSGLDWVWTFNGVLVAGGEWKWDNTWNGVEGVALADAPDIVQRKPPEGLAPLGRIGIEYFAEQGLLRFSGRADDLLRQSRFNAALSIAEEQAAGSTWTGPAIRPASPGYSDPDPGWVQWMTEFNRRGSQVAVITQSGLASVVVAPAASTAWAGTSSYARAFFKNPWLTTTTTVTAGGAFMTTNGPTIVDALVDTGRVAPVISGLGSQLSRMRQVVSFLRNEGISDANLRRQIWEAGLREAVTTDTPASLARFRRIFVQPFREGKAFTGRFGNIDTRVFTIQEAMGLENAGMRPLFEFRVGRRFVDLAGVNPATGELNQLIQLVKGLRTLLITHKSVVVAYLVC